MPWNLAFSLVTGTIKVLSSNLDGFDDCVLKLLFWLAGLRQPNWSSPSLSSTNLFDCLHLKTNGPNVFKRTVRAQTLNNKSCFSRGIFYPSQVANKREQRRARFIRAKNGYKPRWSGVKAGISHLKSWRRESWHFRMQLLFARQSTRRSKTQTKKTIPAPTTDLSLWSFIVEMSFLVL